MRRIFEADFGLHKVYLGEVMQVQDVLSAIDNKDDHAATEFYAEVDGYIFDLSKDGESENWYIQVKPEAEGHLYDGWWPFSEDKSLSQAVEEALVSSQLIPERT